jgi:hypothetical protein
MDSRIYALPKKTIEILSRALSDIREATDATDRGEYLGALTNAKGELERLNRYAMEALLQVDPKWQ